VFGSEILEVAIGLVFFYLLLSLICTMLTELISRALALRSTNLEEGVKNLLNDPGGTALAKELYNHPLVASLAKRGDSRRWLFFRYKSKPSYIPARNFALALFDLIAPSNSMERKTIKEVRAKVVQLPTANEDVRRQLLTLIGAEYTFDEALKSVETWFNDAMDRVSGWYKRKAELITLALGLFISILLNADTLMLANVLAINPTLRASVVAAAERRVERPIPAESDTPLTQASELQAELKQLNLPIGWLRQSENQEEPQEVPDNPTTWFYKIVGLLFTSIAVSLGAPFWFDLLERFVNLRGAGRKPERADQENSSV
jgi:hypothetical protein